MDATEKLVRQFLVSQGFDDIKYEPDGNVPPDFLVDGQIAVEARRLNQNHFGEGKPRGLEEIEIPLWRKAKKLLQSLGPSVSGESWFVFIRFGRPMLPWTALEPKLRMALERFMHQPERRNSTVFAERGFEVDLYRASQPHPQLFLMSGSSDAESGGPILAEIEKTFSTARTKK